MPVEIPKLDLPVHTLKRDTYLLERGQEAVEIFIVLSGRILILKEDSVIGARADLVTGPDFVGVELLNGAAHYDVSAKTLVNNCLVQPINWISFQELMEKDRLLQQSLLLSEHQRAQRLWRFKTTFDIKDAKPTIARALLDLAGGDPPVIIGVKQEDMAALVGIRREVLNRYLRILQGIGLINVQGRGRKRAVIQILNTKGLALLAGE